MVFSQDHPDKKLRGVAKGMKEVLHECESAWDELTKRCGKVVVGDSLYILIGSAGMELKAKNIYKKL